MHSTSVTKTDSRTQQDVLREFKWDTQVEQADVRVEVAPGVVTITGNVTGEAGRMAAQGAARRVVGVSRVVNNIHVRPAGAVVPAAPVPAGRLTRLPSAGLVQAPLKPEGHPESEHRMGPTTQVAARVTDRAVCTCGHTRLNHYLVGNNGKSNLEQSEKISVSPGDGSFAE